MSGRWGNSQAMICNLDVVQIDTENNVLLVRGAIPGCERWLRDHSQDEQVGLVFVAVDAMRRWAGLPVLRNACWRPCGVAVTG